MGGVQVSPGEIIGEPLPSVDVIEKTPEQKHLEHLFKMEELDKKKQEKWLASLGFMAPSDTGSLLR